MRAFLSPLVSILHSAVAALLLLIVGTACVSAQGMCPPPPHTHNWTAYTHPTGDFIVGINGYGQQPEFIRRYEIVELAVLPVFDWDECANPDCDFTGGIAEDNGGRPTCWSDGDLGGEFGYLQNGAFVPTSPSDTDHITHYRAPRNISGIIEFSLEIDDCGYAADPNGHVVATYDDPPFALGPKQATCWEFTISKPEAEWVPTPQNVQPMATATGTVANITPDETSFNYVISPPVDHMGRSMAANVEWRISPSEEPGYCCNSINDIVTWSRPLNSVRNDAWIKETPNIVYFPDPEDFTCAFTNMDLTDEIFLQNFDYGTHGGITAQLASGYVQGAMARQVGSVTHYGSEFPQDDNGNFIADAAPNGLDEGTADEDVDGGVGTPGDGLCRYEEYRGFMIAGTYHRLDPMKKDLFIDDENNLFHRSYFASALPSIEMHVIGAEESLNLVVNFQNEGVGLRHIVDQHCLWLIDGGSAPFGQHMFWGGTEHLGPGGPGKHPAVVVFVEQIITDTHADAPDKDPAHPELGQVDPRTDEVIATIITHELGHGVGIDEHVPMQGGDVFCAMRYFNLEYHSCKRSAGNNALAWLGIVMGNRFCTTGDNCEGQIRISDRE